ncbi:MAG: hypothetical protein Q9187_006407 [Circinaria calcarea]
MCREFIERALANSITTVVADHFVALLTSRYEFFRLAQSDLGGVLRRDPYDASGTADDGSHSGARVHETFRFRYVGCRILWCGGRQFADPAQAAEVDKQKELWMENVEIAGSAVEPGSRSGQESLSAQRRDPPHLMAAEQLPRETEKMITMMEGQDHVRKPSDNVGEGKQRD